MGDPDWSAENLLAELAAARSREAAKDERIDLLLVQIAELTTQVQALVLRLSKDSSTSSKPPSPDGPGKRPRGGSSRTRSGRNPGKQPGDPGTTLRQADDPDERMAIPAPSACAGCDRPLIEVPVGAVRRRQVFDLAEPPPAAGHRVRHRRQALPRMRKEGRRHLPCRGGIGDPVRSRDHHEGRGCGPGPPHPDAPLHTAGDGAVRDEGLYRIRRRPAFQGRPSP